jgi:hypothetical protein
LLIGLDADENMVLQLAGQLINILTIFPDDPEAGPLFLLKAALKGVQTIKWRKASAFNFSRLYLFFLSAFALLAQK